MIQVPKGEYADIILGGEESLPSTMASRKLCCRFNTGLCWLPRHASGRIRYGLAMYTVRSRAGRIRGRRVVTPDFDSYKYI
jgi:hypothetical protein